MPATPRQIGRIARAVVALTGCVGISAAAMLAAGIVMGAARVAGERCFATMTDGALVYASADAGAIQQAVDAAGPGSVVKVAGFCAGVRPGAGFTQTVLLGQSLTLQGGYTTTDWASAYPLTQATMLDAQGLGRVLLIPAAGATLDGLILTGGATGGDGGALYALNAITLSRVVVVSNTAGGNGGGLLAVGSLTLIDTHMSGNLAGASGGGVFAFGPATVMSASFADNSVLSYGGGALLAVTATVSGTIFSDNVASVLGGGLYAGGATRITDSMLEGNRATNVSAQAGGAYLAQAAHLAGVTFDANIAAGACGGLRAIGLLFADAVTFTLNQAVAGSGGAACADNGAQISGGVVVSNTSGNHGGGFVVLSGAAIFTDALFARNAAATSGGGLYANAGAALVGGRWISNTAQTCGGARAGGLLEGRGMAFELNQATAGMGGALCGSAGAHVADSALVSNTAAGNGGGLHVSAGAVTLTAVSLVGNTGLNGGGAYASGDVVAQQTVWERNTARSACGGLRAGGLFAGAWVTFTHNTAAGLGGNGGAACANSANVTDATLLANAAANSGGALYVSPGGVTVTAGVFASNAVTSADGGGLYATGPAHLIDTRFEENRGPGAFGFGGGAYLAGDALLTNTTFIANRSGQGGGLHVRGAGAVVVTLVNAVFARNASIGGEGAALYAAGLGGDDLFTIMHTTIASPTQAMSAAIYIASGSAAITNTIIASHVVGIRNGAASVTEDYNLFVGNAQDVLGVVIRGAQSITGAAGFVDPLMDDLGLTGASPAIDAGADVGVTFDRDGAARPFGRGYDIGAYEWRGRTFFVYLPSSTIAQP